MRSRGKLGLLPLPQGEGWGEGLRSLDGSVTPSPQPSPQAGRGSGPRSLLKLLGVGRPSCGPFLDDAGERVEPVGQRRRPRLQDERRFDLAQEAVAHGGNVGETRPRRDLGGDEFLAAPGADDDVGLGGDQFLPRYDAVLGVLASGQRGKHIDAAGDFDEFGGPADAGDHRLIPFLEIDPWMAFERGRAGARLREPPLQRPHERAGLAGRADQRAERADHVENAGDVAMVEGMDRDVAADQLGGDLGLQVGEGEHEVGLEREDFLKVGGDERRHPRLLLAHPRRPHRVARHADDAPLLAEEIKRLHGLFGEADDALGRKHSAAAHSDSATGWLTSEVAPPADVSVAVNEAGIAASLAASTVSENRPSPSASDVAATLPRNISPSPLPAARLPNTSTVKRDSGLPRSSPCTMSSPARLRTRSSVGAARPPFGGGWQLGAPSGQILARLPAAAATPAPPLRTDR